jgi:hypothetical protein
MGAGLIATILGFLLKALGIVVNKKPDAVSEGEKAGAAEQALQDVESGDAQVTQAIQAGDAADQRAAADPDSLRAPDSQSRD